MRQAPKSATGMENKVGTPRQLRCLQNIFRGSAIVRGGHFSTSDVTVEDQDSWRIRVINITVLQYIWRLFYLFLLGFFISNCKPSILGYPHARRPPYVERVSSNPKIDRQVRNLYLSFEGCYILHGKQDPQ